MSGLRFAIEFSLYLLSCLIANVSFVYINYVFVRKSFNSIIIILIYYIFYFIILLCFFPLPLWYIFISACFPSSVFACNDAAISLIFWVFFVLPCYAFFNITLFIILIVKILGPKKALQTKPDSADVPSE
jgi:hypothetical protein